MLTVFTEGYFISMQSYIFYDNMMNIFYFFVTFGKNTETNVVQCVKDKAIVLYCI